MNDRSPPPDPLRRDRAELPERPPLRPFVVEGPRVRVLVLSPSVTTVFVHWNGLRTLPCLNTGPDTLCPHCGVGSPLLRQRWLMVQDLAATPWLPQACCLTDAALEHDPMIWETDGRLDGRYLDLWRSPAHRKGRMYARLHQDDQAATWPEVEDVLSVLRRMWGGKLRAGKGRGGEKPAEPT